MRQACYSSHRNLLSSCAAVNVYTNEIALTFRVTRNYGIETQSCICVRTQNLFDGLLGTDGYWHTGSVGFVLVEETRTHYRPTSPEERATRVEQCLTCVVWLALTNFKTEYYDSVGSETTCDGIIYT